MPCGSASGQRPVPPEVGIDLHPAHHDLVLRKRPKTAWLEVHAENFMTRGGMRADLELIAHHYPLSMHAVGLSLGSVGLPDSEHLGKLREWVEHLQPDLISDHLCWSAIEGVRSEEALDVVIRNVVHVQDCLKRPLLLENSSTCLELPQSALSEAEFLAEVALRTGCGVLLDLNNIQVSASNRGSDAGQVLEQFLQVIPHETIGEIHLAGQRVVWNLYARAVQELGPVPTLIEWDSLVPPFETMQEEARIAQSLMDECC